MSSFLLELNDVSYTYPHAEGPALTDVGLQVPAGGSVGLVGESGAGKTTLLRLLTGMARPTGGEVLFDGERLDVGDRRQMRLFRRSVQMVFQDPYSSLDPQRRIGWIVAEPLRMLRGAGGRSRLSRAETRDRAFAVLESVGLPADVAKRYPRQFSGGQRQRIAIARAIVCAPRVLVGDEPVSALDLSTRIKVLDLLNDLRHRYGLAIVTVSHDLSAIAMLCDDVVVLEQGRVVESGPTKQVLASPEHHYSRRLVESVPLLRARPGTR